MNIFINPHIQSLKESATLAINLRAKQLRAQGKQICHFGFGQSPFPVHEKIQEALRSNSHQKDYLPTLGLLELREEICRYYKQHYKYDFHPDRVLVGPGSKELIFQVLFILEGPVLIPAPSWVSYGPQVHIRGKYTVGVITGRKNGYKLTASGLEKSISGLQVPQKILIMNSPNNPTGAVYKDREIKALADVCRRHNVVVISDEIYGPIDFTGKKKRGFSYYYPEGTIVTAGLSKTHSAGGYRLGFLAVPEGMDQVMKALSAMVSETFSAVSAPTQYAAVKAYSDDADLVDYVDNCTKIHKVCGEYLHNRFVQMGMESVLPEGAFYLFPSFNPYREAMAGHNISGSSSLTKALLEQQGVAALPGTDFYFPESELCTRIASVDYDGAEVFKMAETVNFSLDHKFVERHCTNLKTGADRVEEFLKSL